MRVLLLLGLLPGCLWSKHVHDYNVDLDGPAALEVRVITADGVQTVLPAGSPEDRGTIVVDNVPLTVIRDAQGIRVEAEKALTELQLVDAYGKTGVLTRDQAWVRPGKGVVIEHNFVFGTMHGLTYDASSYVVVQASADWGHVEHVDARQHPSRNAGLAMWIAEFGLLIPTMKFVAEGNYVPAAALVLPMGVLGWWGLGQLVGPRRDYQVYPEVSP